VEPGLVLEYRIHILTRQEIKKPGMSPGFLFPAIAGNTLSCADGLCLVLVKVHIPLWEGNVDPGSIQLLFDGFGGIEEQGPVIG